MIEHKFDYTLFLVVLILLAIGVVMIYSASAFVAQQKWHESAFFLKKQLLWFALSLTVIVGVSKFDYRNYRKLAWPILIGSLVLLAVVFTQPPINGSRRWLFIAGNSFQPAELFKFALVIFTAYYFSEHPELVNSLKRLAWPYGATLVLGLGLVLAEPDLGMTFVLCMVLLALLFMAGMRLRYLIAGSVLPVLLVVLMVLLLNYNSERLQTFLGQGGDDQRETYQVQQSLLAIGSGGMFGRGIGRGYAKLLHLPESHTDFIIANLAEEGGFILVAACLVLYFVLVTRGLRIASLAQDRFGFFLAFGIITLLATNVLINIGMATRLLPTTGLALPFLSYGGSSLLCSAFGVGLVLNISRHQCEVSVVLARHNA